MKNKCKIFSIISGLLVLVFLIGSSGAVVVFHSCNAHGKEPHADLLSHDHSLNSDCCFNTLSCTPASERAESLDNDCCTFTVEKFNLANFNLSVQVKVSAEYPLVVICQTAHVNEFQQKPYLSLFIHNKHGGRDTLISNCQFII